MSKNRHLAGQKSVLLVPQCAGISDPFHFYLGYFLPLMGDTRLDRISRQSRRALYQMPRLSSLQGWTTLGISIREIDAEPLEGDVLQEYLRRRRWTSRLVRRDTTMVLPDSDNVHKLGSIGFRRLLTKAKSQLLTHGLLEQPAVRKDQKFGRACIMVRAKPDPLKPVAFPRHVPNLSEVGRFLEAKGWDVVYLDAAIQSPETVLKTVSSSNLLVGQYGAGLAHSMWLSKTASVIEISAESDNPMPSWVYKRLAESASIRFIQSRCQTTWTAPASLKEFELSYAALSHRPLTILENVRSAIEAYFHIYFGRILISAGLKKS